MTTDTPGFWTRELGGLLALLFVCGWLFFYGLGKRPLWNDDEGLHASVAREMVEGGDWITPRFNGRTFYDKPILFFWLNALSFKSFGINECAARLPAALLGVAGVAVTYLFGRTLFGAAVGLSGGMILATSLGYVVLSRTIVHDISLAFFISLSLLFFYWGYQGGRHRRWWYRLFYAAAGMAVLSKGPLGLLLPALVIGLFLLSQGEWRRLKEMEPGWGAVVFALIAVPWYVLASLRDGDFASYFFLQKNLGSFFSSKVEHHEAFHFYIPMLLMPFFPWSCFLPAALVRSCPRRWRSIRTLNKEDLFLFIWFSAMFGFFSLASSKMATYLLPLYPAAALLVARLCQADWDGSSQESPSKGFAYSMLAYSMAVALLALGVAIYLPLRFRSFPPLNFLPSALVMIGAGVAAYFWFFRENKRKIAFLSIGVMVVLLMVTCVHWVFPPLNGYRSSKGLAGHVDTLLQPGEEVVFFGNLKESVLFYTDRKARVIRDPEILFRYLDSSKRVYCLTDERRYRKLGEPIQVAAEIVAREGQEILLANRPRVVAQRGSSIPRPDRGGKTGL